MKRGYRAAALAIAAALLLGLTGCMGREAGELFALPQPPDDYKALNAAIEQVLRDTGGESIAPTSGSNPQTVQLQDLDGDGVLESAVAFVRVPGDEKPLKIYVFRETRDETYVADTVISGVGSAINSVAYENVGGSSKKEVIVSWQISGTDHTMGVYSLGQAEGIELLWVDSYSRFRLTDLDGDGEKEAVVITLQTSEEDVTRADYYDFDGAAMALASTATLSAGINEIKSIRSGNLAGGEPAMFVTSSFVDNSDQVVDILACRDGVLTNISLASDILCSTVTVRSYNAVSGTDINNDGIMELPRPFVVPKPKGVYTDVWYIEWRSFDITGEPNPVFTTFHNVTDGWYLRIPEGWEEEVTVSRRDAATVDERAVVFSHWEGEDQDAVPFLILYKFTGSRQNARATQGRRVVVRSDSTATYAAELLPNSWDCGIDQDEITRRFNLIRTEWSIEN